MQGITHVSRSASLLETLNSYFVLGRLLGCLLFLHRSQLAASLEVIVARRSAGTPPWLGQRMWSCHWRWESHSSSGSFTHKFVSGLFVTYFGSKATFRGYGIVSTFVLVAFVFINFYRKETGFISDIPTTEDPHQVWRSLPHQSSAELTNYFCRLLKKPVT